MKIKYLVHYNTPDNPEKRGFFAAAATKVEYVAAAMETAGYDVEIISASNTVAKQNSPGKRKRISDRTSLVLLPCLGRGGRLKNKLSTAVFYLRLFWYLLSDLKREDTLVVYHSLALMPLVRLLKRLRGFRLVLEAEEIYGDVTEDAATVAREMDYFRMADAYVFVSELLNQKINTRGKPYAVAHGTYRAEPARGARCFDEPGQPRIHCVYAGTFDPRKGVLTAIESAAYLPPVYWVHILGYGSGEDAQRVRDLCGAVSERGGCRVSYDGFLRGEEYIRTIQSCDIGLSPQDADAKFNATSFPSKILSYMSNGLRVVSIRLPAIESSGVGAHISYYDSQDPREVAAAIMKVDVNDGYSSREVLRELDRTFRGKLRNVLEAAGDDR